MENIKAKFKDKFDAIITPELRNLFYTGTIYFLKVLLAIVLGFMTYLIVMESSTRFNTWITVFIALTSTMVAFFIYLQGIKGMDSFKKIIDLSISCIFIYLGYCIFMYVAFWVSSRVSQIGGFTHGSIAFLVSVVVGVIFVVKFFYDSKTRL